MTKNLGHIITFEEMIAENHDSPEEYIPLCKRIEGKWPCAEICGEMCDNWNTDRCKEKDNG